MTVISQVMQRPLLLSRLPYKPVKVFERDELIYGAGQQADYLFLVSSGRVKLSIPPTVNGHMASTVVRAEELFGETSLIGAGTRHENAIAITQTALIAWTREEIEHAIHRDPLLGITLAKYFVGRSVEIKDRIEIMSVYGVGDRLRLALLLLAGQVGAVETHAEVRLPPITHELLGGYVGLTREQVTSEMNELRRKGVVRYSRKCTDVFPVLLWKDMIRTKTPLPYRYRPPKWKVSALEDSVWVNDIIEKQNSDSGAPVNATTLRTETGLSRQGGRS